MSDYEGTAHSPSSRFCAIKQQREQVGNLFSDSRHRESVSDCDLDVTIATRVSR